MFFPVLVNLAKYNCLVIGGGNVAYRKVTSLQNFKAKITVISPKFCGPLKELSIRKKIKIISANYNKDLLNDFDIIFCATDNPKLNLTVHQDCKKEKKLLNVADVPELCDFILPAIVKRGDLTISVSSQGKAPFYAAEVKRKLDHIFPEYYKDIVEIAGDYRLAVLSDKKMNNTSLKRKAFDNFFNINWKKILETIGKRNAKKNLKKIIKGL